MQKRNKVHWTSEVTLEGPTCCTDGRNRSKGPKLDVVAAAAADDDKLY
jgi:hypothetical protein